MKLIICICLIVLFSNPLKAQEDETIVRKIADNVLKNDAFQFEGVYNNQTYNSGKDVPDTVTVRLKSGYSGWYYVNGVLNMAMIDLGDFLKDEKYPDSNTRGFAWPFSLLLLKPFLLHYRYRPGKSEE